MASPTLAFLFSNPRMTLSTSIFSQRHCPFLLHDWNHSVSASCCIKLPRMEKFDKPSVFKACISYSKEKLWALLPDSVKNLPWEKVENAAVQSKEKLWASVPDSVKNFPWEKAKNVAVQQLPDLGKETLKWSLIVFFFLSSISDIVFSISSNREILIPFGLFVGCMLTDFLRETSRELLLNSKERDVTWQLLGISCFFVLLKVISVCFPVGLGVFLCHAANGGALQVLWHYTNLAEQDDENAENLAPDTSMTRAAEDQPLPQS